MSLDATRGPPESLARFSSLPGGPAEGPRCCVSSACGARCRGDWKYQPPSWRAETGGRGQERGRRLGTPVKPNLFSPKITRGSRITLGRPGQVQLMAHNDTGTVLCAPASLVCLLLPRPHVHPHFFLLPTDCSGSFLEAPSLPWTLDQM